MLGSLDRLLGVVELGPMAINSHLGFARRSKEADRPHSGPQTTLGIRKEG